MSAGTGYFLGIGGVIDARVRVRRGTRAELDSVTLAEGEVGYVTDLKYLVDGDGSTQGANIAGVSNGPSFTTSSPGHTAVNNGTKALASLVRAKALTTPYGVARSATNRVKLKLPGGVYDLGSGSLLLDTQFVDLEGDGKDATIIISSGAPITQTANDVRISNLWCYSTAGAAIAATGANTNTIWRNLRIGLSDGTGGNMPDTYTFSGLYQDCEFYGSFFEPTINGRFERCVFNNPSGVFITIADGTGEINYSRLSNVFQGPNGGSIVIRGCILEALVVDEISTISATTRIIGCILSGSIGSRSGEGPVGGFIDSCVVKHSVNSDHYLRNGFVRNTIFEGTGTLLVDGSVLESCRVKATDGNSHAVEARATDATPLFLNSTLVASGSGQSIETDGAVNVGVNFCTLRGSLDGSLVNVLTGAVNITDADVR